MLDLSQLIYSHPAFDIINRENDVCGQPIPFTMLTSKGKSAEGPTYEAAVRNAESNDPFFRNMGDNDPENTTARVGFYEASNVRYTRTACNSLSPTWSSSFVHRLLESPASSWILSQKRL